VFVCVFVKEREREREREREGEREREKERKRERERERNHHTASREVKSHASFRLLHGPYPTARAMYTRRRLVMI